MKQIKIGAITIGQAPRTDITRDILPLLPDYMTLTEYGALDDMTYEEVMSQFAPSEDDEVLVSRMRDGRQAKFTERFIRPLVQKKIDQAEAEGVSAIILFCTGVFPEFRHQVLFIEPQPLFHAIAAKLACLGNGYLHGLRSAGGQSKNRHPCPGTGSGGTGLSYLGQKRHLYRSHLCLSVSGI